jgi:hypothetical protein
MQPSYRDMRMSNADRERVVERLNQAVSEGRLTLDEFEERVDGVLKARTYGEIDQFVADLPAVAPANASPVAAKDRSEIRNNASTLRRAGRWAVPRKLRVLTKAGSVKLNFAEALISQQLVEIDLDGIASSIELILPANATADLDDVERIASSVKSRVPAGYDAQAGGFRFQITGKLKASSLKVRYEHRVWRWHW